MTHRELTLVALVAIALWQLGAGIHIVAKARLAQVLLLTAWDRAAAGEARPTPWPWADTWPVARLRVPGRDVDLIVLAGATGRTLAFAPGHLHASTPPGEVGNTVISGHRDTHFTFLADLVPNDYLTLETPNGGSAWYRVTTTDVVDSRTSRLRLDADEPTLTLVTCYPFDAVDTRGSLRYVVSARRVLQPGHDLPRSASARSRVPRVIS